MKGKMGRGEEKERNPAKKEYGGVAQLGEHLPCKQGVRSSTLLISTTDRKSLRLYLEN